MFPQRRYGGFDCDSSLYPGKEAAELFLRHYLAGEVGRPEDVVSSLFYCWPFPSVLHLLEKRVILWGVPCGSEPGI